MAEISQVVVESVAKEKLKHGANALGTGTAMTFSDLLGWLPHVAAVIGILVSCAIFYKTYLEIQLAKIRISNEGRREDDRVEGQESPPGTMLRYNARRRD